MSPPAAMSNDVGGCAPRNCVLWEDAWFQAFPLLVASTSGMFPAPWAECVHCDSPCLARAGFQVLQDCTRTRSSPNPKKSISLGAVFCSSPHTTDPLRGLVWLKWCCEHRLHPALRGQSSSLITSSVYASSSVRSRANSTLALAVSLTNVVLTVSVPSSLFPLSL